MATDSANSVIEAGKVVDIITTKKLFLLNSRTGLAHSSQQAGVSDWMIRQFEPTMRDNKIDISKLQYSQTVQLFTEYVREYMGHFTKDMPVSLLRSESTAIAFILCGYDEHGEASIVQSISSSVPNAYIPDILPNKRCSFGVREETLYWLKVIERAGISIASLDVATLKRLCVFLIQETIDRDPDYVRAPIQMIAITHDGGSFISGLELAKLAKPTIRTNNLDKILHTLGIVNQKKLGGGGVNQ